MCRDVRNPRRTASRRQVYENREQAGHLQGYIPRAEKGQAFVEQKKILLLNERIITVGRNVYPQSHCVKMSHYLILFKSGSEEIS